MKGYCNVKVYLKPFSGAKTNCMIDYPKPSVCLDPDHFILHVRRNDLKSEKSSEFIAESIIDLAVSLKNEKRDVNTSIIIVRTENQEQTKKAMEVNKYLSEFCKEMNLYFIYTSKRIKPQHLNKSKLHLCKNSVRILSDIYYKEILKIFN